VDGGGWERGLTDRQLRRMVDTNEDGVQVAG